MTDKRIVYTLQDNKVCVLAPAPQCLFVLEHGGGICFETVGRMGLYRFMRDLKISQSEIDAILMVNLLPLPVARAWEITKFVRAPDWRPGCANRQAIATRWIDALIWGGHDEDSALRLIRDKDVPVDAVAVEIIDKSEIPDDRGHRSAWRRSRNGGPIWIDEDEAIKIDEARMWTAYERRAV